MRVVNWLLSPAFTDETSRATVWIINFGFMIVALWGVPYPINYVADERDRGIAIADAKLRDVAWQRMQSVCFTDDEIKHYWYEREFSQTPNKIVVLVRGREALCGGRGLCGCKTKRKAKGSV